MAGKHNRELRSYTYLPYKWNPPQAPERAVTAAEEYVSQDFPGIACIRLPQLTGLKRARELVLTGRELSAQEAFKIGLVNELVDGGHLTMWWLSPRFPFRQCNRGLSI